LVFAEGSALRVARAAVERQRLGLVDARLESHDTESFVRRFAFNPREDRPAESLASSRRRDIHALHFTVIRSNTQRAAGEWRAIEPRDEKTDVRPRELLEVEEVVGGRRIQ